LEEHSEQHVISCDTTDGGRDDGDLPTAFAYVKKAGGIAPEKDYPEAPGLGMQVMGLRIACLGHSIDVRTDGVVAS